MSDKETPSRVYSRLQDEESRVLFGHRLLYSLTGDYSNILRLLDGFKPYKLCLERLRSAPEREKYIFGAGTWGREILKYFPCIKWTNFIDNYPTAPPHTHTNTKLNDLCTDIPIISFDEFLSRYDGGEVIISPKKPVHNAIERQLLDSGVPQDRICNIGKLLLQLSREQYFDLPYLPHDENEIFVDGGCLDGESSLQFVQWANNRYRHIHMFEPSESQRAICCGALRGYGSAIFHPFALWNKSETLNLLASDSLPTHNAIQSVANSSIDRSNVRAERISCVSLDEYLGDERVTFIKLDIEGAEFCALQGAERIIRKHRPKMAVSVYHRPDDIIDIPKLLLDFNPDYRFYIRHYAFNDWETVLYAI